jgi:cob(I)alamin adenosyltransferase
MGIVTKRGDAGQTDLTGRVRTSKASLRVEAYGMVDELISQLGFARSICKDEETNNSVRDIQRTLFRVCSSLATPPVSKVEPPELETGFVHSLDGRIRKLETTGAIDRDWSLPGEATDAAAMDVARTVCRRTERAVVRMIESGDEVHPNVIAYLNRLSDLLWLFARQLEVDAGIEGKLRDDRHPGSRWSRAW